MAFPIRYEMVHSETGYGGYVAEHGPCVSCGQWPESEAQHSSTWREVAAVLNVLMGVADKPVNHCVHCITDNQNVARILSVGSKKPHLLASPSRFSLEPEWIPSLNETADYISQLYCRLTTSSPVVLADIDCLWGPHTVDCFASCFNNQIPRSNSRSWMPGSEAVDAFTLKWVGEIIGCSLQ